MDFLTPMINIVRAIIGQNNLTRIISMTWYQIHKIVHMNTFSKVKCLILVIFHKFKV